MSDSTPRLCDCGCGTPASRRYRPGHDARHKSRLIEAALNHPVVPQRNRAVRQLVQLGWGHYLPPATLQATPPAPQSVHIDDLIDRYTILSPDGLRHSRWFCPGSSAADRDPLACSLLPPGSPQGFPCSICIHVFTLDEIAEDMRRYTWATTVGLQQPAPAYEVYEFDPETGNSRLVPTSASVSADLNALASPPPPPTVTEALAAVTAARSSTPTPDPDPSPLSHLVCLEDVS